MLSQSKQVKQCRKIRDRRSCNCSSLTLYSSSPCNSTWKSVRFSSPVILPLAERICFSFQPKSMLVVHSFAISRMHKSGSTISKLVSNHAISNLCSAILKLHKLQIARNIHVYTYTLYICILVSIGDYTWYCVYHNAVMMAHEGCSTKGIVLMAYKGLSALALQPRFNPGWIWIECIHTICIINKPGLNLDGCQPTYWCGLKWVQAGSTMVAIAMNITKPESKQHPVRYMWTHVTWVPFA